MTDVRCQEKRWQMPDVRRKDDRCRMSGEKMSERIRSFRDLDVYKKLCELHLEIHEFTLKFPKFELYELGSQMRRSSNSIPANLAEGYNNKHIKIYLEGINRALAELQETEHHLYIAYRKEYFTKEKYESYIERYEECARMLYGLYNSVKSGVRKQMSDDRSQESRST